MRKIVVGSKILMELAGIKDKLQSFFVGYINKRCVIISFPLVPEVNRPLMLEHLYKGNMMTIRYIYSGMVLGFSTEIQHVAFTPYPLLFVRYPERIESFNLRKDERVACLFPASLTLHEVLLHGALSDISVSGCNIVLPIDDETTSVEVGDQLALRCPLLFAADQVEIACTVKLLTKDDTKVRLGLKFTHVPADLLARIKSYIEQTLMFMDTG